MSGTNRNAFDVKKLLRSILAITMVATIILGCVGMLAGCKKADGGNDVTPGGDNAQPENPYANMTDAEYMQALTMNELKGTVDAVATGVGAYADLAGAITGSVGTKAEIDLQLGELIIGMLEATLTDATNMTLDLDFLSKIGLDIEVDSNADLAQLKLGLGLSDTEILSLIALVNQENAWISVPELNDGFLQVGLADLGVTVNTAQTEVLADLANVLPSEDKLAEVLTRYLGIAVKEMVTVERGTEKLELDGLTQDCTKLTAKIYEENALNAVKAVLTAAKDDQDIKKIVDDASTFYNDMMRENTAVLDMEWTDVDLYPEFTKIIDGALTSLPAAAEDTETYIGLTVYIDSTHNIIGGCLILPGEETSACTYYTVTQNNEFATLFEIPAAAMKVTGKGATADGSIDGTFAIAVQGKTLMNVDVKDFDVNDKDALSGTITLKPTADLLTMIFNTATPLDMTSFALELKLDITNEKSDVEIKLTGDDALILGVAVKAGQKAAATIQAPSDAVDVTDYLELMGWVTKLDLDTVINNLRTAGVPDDLVGIVEGLIPGL